MQDGSLQCIASATQTLPENTHFILHVAAYLDRYKPLATTRTALVTQRSTSSSMWRSVLWPPSCKTRNTTSRRLMGILVALGQFWAPRGAVIPGTMLLACNFKRLNWPDSQRVRYRVNYRTRQSEYRVIRNLESNNLFSILPRADRSRLRARRRRPPTTTNLSIGGGFPLQSPWGIPWGSPLGGSPGGVP